MGNVVKFGKRPAKPEVPKVSMVPTWFDDRFNYDPHWLTDALCMSDNGVARETDACGPPELPLQFAGTGERVPMIKPQQQQQVEVPSPIESLATTIALMAANRKALESKGDDGLPSSILLEDLALLVDEHVVIGLRTQWARRVAVPILAAHRALQKNLGTEQERAGIALDALRQCTNVAVLDACIKWLKGKYHV